MKSGFNSKPLKGPLLTGAAELTSLSVGSIDVSSDVVEGLISGNGMSDVRIKDSEIDSTVIGLNGPSDAYFSTIRIFDSIIFSGYTPGDTVIWDAVSGKFEVTGDYHVSGCAYLGDIEICGNSVKGTGIDGDIHLKPTGAGSIYLDAPVITKVSSGSLTTQLLDGGITTIVHGDIVSDSLSMTAKTNSDQVLATRKGDIVLRTDDPNDYHWVRVTGTMDTLISTGITLYPGDTVDISGDLVSILSVNGTHVKTNKTLSISGTLSVPRNHKIILDSTEVVIPGSLVIGDTTLKSSNNVIEIDTDLRVAGGVYADVVHSLSGSVNLPDVAIRSGTITGITEFETIGQTNLDKTVLTSTLGYSVENKVVESSPSSPDRHSIVTFLKIVGISDTTLSGEMPDGVHDGLVKKVAVIECGEGCMYTLFFGDGKLIVPGSGTRFKLQFDSKGQYVELIWTAAKSAWVLSGGSCFTYAY